MASDLNTIRGLIESSVSSTWASRTAIQWADRPFTAPSSGGWLRVSILWGDAFPYTLDGLNQIPGVVDCGIFDLASRGLGNATTLGEYARRMLSQLQLTGVTFGVPSGPVPVAAREGFAHVVVSAPFVVVGT